MPKEIAQSHPKEQEEERLRLELYRVESKVQEALMVYMGQLRLGKRNCDRSVLDKLKEEQEVLRFQLKELEREQNYQRKYSSTQRRKEMGIFIWDRSEEAEAKEKAYLERQGEEREEDTGTPEPELIGREQPESMVIEELMPMEGKQLGLGITLEPQTIETLDPEPKETLESEFWQTFPESLENEESAPMEKEKVYLEGKEKDLEALRGEYKEVKEACAQPGASLAIRALRQELACKVCAKELEIEKEKEKAEPEESEPLEIEEPAPIEIEAPELIVIEEPAPIEIEPRPEITIDRSKLVRINVKGEPTLRAKQLPKTNKEHYDSVKLPNQSKDPEGYKKARAERLEASDIAKFTTYTDEVPPIFAERLYGISKEFCESDIEDREMGNFLEDRTHKRLAKSLFSTGKGRLGDFEFSGVYLSKNRQYVSNDLPLLGEQLDAWGILGRKKTVIEIKSTEHFNFERLEKALALEDFELGNVASVQDLLHESAPYYYYQIQAQLLCTGLTQALLHVINRNTFKTLSVLIKADLKAFAWIQKITEQYEATLKVYKDCTPEDLEEDWNDLNLHFDLDYPAPKVRKRAEADFWEKVALKVQADPLIKEDLDALRNLEKAMTKLKDKLTDKGFGDSQRKAYEKLLKEEGGTGIRENFRKTLEKR